MKVTLIAHTPDPEKVIATAGRICYSGKSVEAILFSMTDPERVEKQLGVVHGSCFEHASFTFAIEGVSRDCTHQLVRHRIASFSQRSQRYVSEADGDTVTPQSIVDTDGAEFIYQKAVDSCYATYRTLLDMGIPKEDARYILPGSAESTIMVTMNVRELMHFFGLRCCTRAQKEIREVAEEMLRLCREVSPMLFDKVGAQCVQLGYCPEHRPCGKMPTFIDLKEGWY